MLEIDINEAEGFGGERLVIGTGCSGAVPLGDVHRISILTDSLAMPDPVPHHHLLATLPKLYKQAGVQCDGALCYYGSPPARE